MHRAAARAEIPRAFCWTRIGVEAGQDLSSILQRKEVERLATGGLFVWGVGNAVARGVNELARSELMPTVLFSPIRGPAALIDRVPSTVVAWTTYIDELNIPQPLPEGVIVTSRGVTGRGIPKRFHYALFCRSKDPLALNNFGSVDFHGLRNVQTSRRVGFSQVTAVVSTEARNEQNRELLYRIALKAELVPPYCKRLGRAVTLSEDDILAMRDMVAARDVRALRKFSGSLRRRSDSDLNFLAEGA